MKNSNLKPIEIVITLFEKKYHYGVAVLINSLYKSKFDGLIYVGYKGQLPPWISQLEYCSQEFYRKKDVFIRFVKVESLLHFGYYKPFVLKNIFDEYPSVEKVYYFDPDIIINTSWSYFSEWTNCGIGLCLDNCFPFVHHNHPWRKKWIELGGESQINVLNYYVNSGYIGVKRSDKLILDRWINLTIKYQDIGGDTTKFEKDGHRAFKGDQDLLNAALTISPDLNFSIIGQEGMGFSQPAYLMTHAVSDVKPWAKNYLKHLLKRGESPSFIDKDFLRHSKLPINLFSQRKLKLKRINSKVASIIGRFIGG